MNPRIYKKQAKRAVELLRSHGDRDKYAPTGEPGVIDPPFRWNRGRWLSKHRPAEYGLWQRIRGIPESHYQSGFDGEWDGHDSHTGWKQHFEYAMLPADFFEGPEWDNGCGKPWPRLTATQRMNMWRFNQIAPGWRWRGGRAVKVTP